MNLQQKKLKINEPNQYDIFLLDIYMLDYYGVKVFFQVCKTTKNTVFLIELATKKYKNGIMLTKRLKASKNPLIVQLNNTRTKTTYEVQPINLNDKEYWLPIVINYGDKIHTEAFKYCDFPGVGYAYAVPIKNYLNKYWETPTKKIIKEEAYYDA